MHEKKTRKVGYGKGTSGEGGREGGGEDEGIRGRNRGRHGV